MCMIYLSFEKFNFLWSEVLNVILNQPKVNLLKKLRSFENFQATGRENPLRWLDSHVTQNRYRDWAEMITYTLFATILRNSIQQPYQVMAESSAPFINSWLIVFKRSKIESVTSLITLDKTSTLTCFCLLLAGLLYAEHPSELVCWVP